jgi:hypothetical protein
MRASLANPDQPRELWDRAAPQCPSSPHSRSVARIARCAPVTIVVRIGVEPPWLTAVRLLSTSPASASQGSASGRRSTKARVGASRGRTRRLPLSLPYGYTTGPACLRKSQIDRVPRTALRRLDPRRERLTSGAYDSPRRTKSLGYGNPSRNHVSCRYASEPQRCGRDRLAATTSSLDWSTGAMSV